MSRSRDSQPSGPGVPWHGLDDMPPLAVSLGNTLWNRTGSWRYQRPVYQAGTPPCNQACPAGEKVQDYLQLLAQGQLAAALARVREDNPLPGVCGRVCYHPCETACNRGRFDGAVAIHALERLAGEQAARSEQPAERCPQAVAVVGSGPAGLSCAYHLARRGYGVTVFEALGQPGGMLRVGIPAYRLPRGVLDREVEAIAAVGVEFRTGVRVGRDLGLDELRRQFAAVFLAPGAHRSRKLGIGGEESAGVGSGLAFLADLAAGKPVSVAGQVAIVGGGNTAVDVARSARRLGAQPTIVYRRSAAEMPAIAEEVAEAGREGVRIEYLAAPTRVLTQEGRVLGLECVRMRLGELDSSGRRQPVPVAGSEFVLEAQLVLCAIGEDPDLDLLPADLGGLRRGVQLAADPQGLTRAAGVFAGGDAATGRGRVADAIGSGKRAAAAIHRFLAAGGDEAGLPPPVVEFSQLNPGYFYPQPRAVLSPMAVAERLAGFAEVNQGLSADQAMAEAGRCFSCGVCTRCDNCWAFCPDAAVGRTEDGYTVDLDHCKGCGVCVHECPRGAMALEEEAQWRRQV